MKKITGKKSEMLQSCRDCADEFIGIASDMSKAYKDEQKAFEDMLLKLVAKRTNHAAVKYIFNILKEGN